MGVDDVGPMQGDVLNEEADHALALPLRGGGIGPQGREVARQRTDLRLALDAQGGLGGCAGAVVVVLGLTQAPEGVVPVGLQCVGHQPVARVHAEVAPAGSSACV